MALTPEEIQAIAAAVWAYASRVVSLDVNQPAITWGQQKIIANVAGQGALDIENTHKNGFGQYNHATNSEEGSISVGMKNIGFAIGQQNYAAVGIGQRNHSTTGTGQTNSGSVKAVSGYDPDIDGIPGDVWAYANRSLTTNIAGSIIPAAGEPLSIYRDTTITLDFATGTVLDALDTDVWFTMKDDLDALDTTSVIQVQKGIGLNYLDGSEKIGTDKLWAALTVSGTNAQVVINTDASKFLPIYQAKPVSWDLKAKIDGVVRILQSGKIYILPTATRMV